MLQLAGAPACSPFRQRKLLERIQQLAAEVSSLDARYVHFVELEQELTAKQQQVLEQLLGGVSASDHEAACSFWVVPRIGTISHWSSKATDIAHNCGLVNVGVSSVVCVSISI